MDHLKVNQNWFLGFIEFSSGEETAESSGSASVTLVTDALFAEMKNRIDASHVAKVKGIFKFEIQKDGSGIFYFLIKTAFSSGQNQTFNSLRIHNFRFLT